MIPSDLTIGVTHPPPDMVVAGSNFVSLCDPPGFESYLGTRRGSDARP